MKIFTSLSKRCFQNSDAILKNSTPKLETFTFQKREFPQENLYKLNIQSYKMVTKIITSFREIILF